MKLTDLKEYIKSMESIFGNQQEVFIEFEINGTLVQQPAHDLLCSVGQLVLVSKSNFEGGFLEDTSIFRGTNGSDTDSYSRPH